MSESEVAVAEGDSQGRHRTHRDWIRNGWIGTAHAARALAALAVAVVVLVNWPAAPASAAINCSKSAATLVSCNGDIEADTFIITRNGSQLAHNRLGLDPGYEMNVDWDAGTPGVQVVFASADVRIVINPGAGTDHVVVGDANSPASGILAEIDVLHVDAGGNQGLNDTVTVDDSSSVAGRTYAVNGTSITVPNLIDVSVVSTAPHAGITLKTSALDDTVNIQSSGGLGPVHLLTNAGADTFKFTGNSTLQRGSMDGGPGSDLADFGSRTVQVVMNMENKEFDLNGEKAAVDGIERVIGSPVGDVITCHADVACTITGLGGPDQITGSDRDDTFFWATSDGNDTIRGKSGNDRLQVGGTSEPDVFAVEPSDTVTGAKVALLGAKPATVHAEVEDVILDLGAGDDSVGVAPTPASTIDVRGGAQANGDTLNVFTTPVLKPNLEPGSTGAGVFEFVGARPVRFFSIDKLLVNGDFAVASFQFNPTSAQRVESAASVELTVTRTGNQFAQATVNFATASGTATAGQDFTPTSGTLTFQPNETSKKITVPLINDQADEPNETFTVKLSEPSGNLTLGNPSTATVTLGDDDGTGIACSPRPKVAVSTAPDGPGKLKVTLAAESLPSAPNNRLLEVRFQTGANAVVDIAGQTGRNGTFTVPLPDRPAQTTFSVRRTAPGAVTVNLTVVDECGEWKTFVGGGPNAF